MAEDHVAPQISISRTSTESTKKSKDTEPDHRWRQPPRVSTNASNFSRPRHADSWKHRRHSPELDWHLRWDRYCFLNGRVLLIDYISNEKNAAAGKKRRVVSQEFQSLKEIEGFYADKDRAHQAALRVIHVQNAPWATPFLLKKFNMDHSSELVGMDFGRWAKYDKPRQRNGKPFPNGKSWRVQSDPWRNVSRTAFGLDYLKVFETLEPTTQRPILPLSRPVDAKMMHLKSFEDSRSPYGFDVSVQRISVYVQRSLGPPGRVSPDADVKSPYGKDYVKVNHGQHGDGSVDLETLDDSNTVIIFETSASMLLQDTLIQARRDLEKRWRRLSFYLKKEEALDDDRMAAQCTNMILTDIFHALALSWEEFLNVASEHVNILEDKIYDNPADESRAPELWTNSAAWLKVDKIMYIHQDLIKEMQGHMKELEDMEDPQEEWLSTTPAEFDKLSHSVQEDLVQPTTNLSDLMYKSVGIRDSRQSLQLGTSMWRLSWITFIFLPLTFMVGFFGMNVTLFTEPNPNIKWWFLATILLAVVVLFLWYGVKHSIQRRRQTPYQRGIYEHLFTELSNEYPVLWTEEGASVEVNPIGIVSRIKWRLLSYWFTPEKTIHAKTYDLDPDGDAGLGVWAKVKRSALRKWLGEIRAEGYDPLPAADLGASTASLSHTEGAIMELAKISTPVVVAEAEPSAVQQAATYSLHPLGISRQRSNSPRQSTERPSSRGSSGIMVEERDVSSGDESGDDATAGASEPPRNV